METTKSKHNTFGFYLVTCSFLFFVFCVICWILQFKFNVTVLKMSEVGRDPFLLLVIFGLATLFFGCVLWKCCPVIIIVDDRVSKKLLVKNIVTRVETHVDFIDLDGFLTTQIAHERIGMYFPAFCFVYKGQVLQTIDSWYFSNFTELEKALSGSRYLGDKEKKFRLRVLIKKLITKLYNLPGR